MWRHHVADYARRKDEREYTNIDPVVVEDYDYQDNYIARQALELLRKTAPAAAATQRDAPTTNAGTTTAPVRRPWFLQVKIK